LGGKGTRGNKKTLHTFGAFLFPMKKILVTTDLSPASQAGLRFAFQLANQQQELELICFHCFQAMIPSAQNRERVSPSLEEQAKAQLDQLQEFVASVLQPMGIKVGKYRCTVVEDLSPETAILNFAVQEAVDAICISTRGAGNVLKIIGTNTSRILLKSPIPVLVVPDGYHTHAIDRVLYASDLENLEREMAEVVAFAEPVGAKIDLAHIFHPSIVGDDPESLRQTLEKNHPALDRVLFEPIDVESSFAPQLDRLVHKIKPDVVVFFSRTNLSWFDKVFSTKRSEAFSFITTVPMLVFRKMATGE